MYVVHTQDSDILFINMSLVPMQNGVHPYKFVMGMRHYSPLHHKDATLISYTNIVPFMFIVRAKVIKGCAKSLYNVLMQFCTKCLAELECIHKYI